MKEFNLPWIAHLLLIIFFAPIWGAVIRIVRGKTLLGILYLITGAFFGIGWIIDIITMIVNKNITVLT